VPAERVAALRKAFHEAMNDPGFIAEAKKQNLELKELDGEGVAKIVEDAYALSPDIVQATREAVKPLNSAGGP
jgi:tripartite-type tricarboxylate transporter receptor subunit TctC